MVPNVGRQKLLTSLEFLKIEALVLKRKKKWGRKAKGRKEKKVEK